MSGKVYKEAYHCLDHNHTLLLSIIMAFADESGLVNIADGMIISLTGLTVEDFNSSKNFLLSEYDINEWCSGSKLTRTGWSDDFDAAFFTTGRFFVQWDSKRLNQHQWKKIKNIVFERDDYTCQYCGERGGKLECDHKHPISKGGSNDLDNLTTACVPCNRSKSDRTLSEWMV